MSAAALPQGGPARVVVSAVTALCLLWIFASSAQADFGFEPGSAGFDVTATAEGGQTPELRAGAHPYSLVAEINLREGEPGFSDGDLRDLQLELPPGFILNPTSIEKCSLARFNSRRISPFEESLSGESCQDRSQVGILTVRSSYAGGSERTFGVFNLDPPPGFPAQIGASPYGVPVSLVPGIRDANKEFGLTLELKNFPQHLNVRGMRLVLWGTPWSVAHNAQRGNCLNEAKPGFGHAKCSTGSASVFPRLAYLTLPTGCAAPLAYRLRANSWQDGGFEEALALSRDAGGSPSALEDCDSLPFSPETLARLTNLRASSPSGYDFNLTGEGESLIDPKRRVASQVKKAVVRLPEGVTVNPSVGAGLGVCTPAQYQAETVSSQPGQGCPNASKIGEVSVKSPLFEGTMPGSLFLAQPDDPLTSSQGQENPFNSLIALYVVAKSSERGAIVKMAGRVDADHGSGRLTATFDELPQLPYSTLNVRFRDTQRSPLATPSSCGTQVSTVELSPWLDPSKVKALSSTSQINAGIGGGPCPSGQAPFHPRAKAGTLNRSAGSFTPFYLNLTRSDAEQEITSYSAALPPGLVAKLAGISFCPDSAIEAAKRRRGFQELRNPSCPASSEIGRTIAGYGLGSVQAYAPGKLYLAGPFGGQPLSIVAIDAATVGPFDLGVIVIRSAIAIDPKSASVSIDSAASDPIPHIIEGIPTHLRDVRVYVDRPGFTLNPTNCSPFQITSTLRGSGSLFFTSADDSSGSDTNPFQVSNCSALGFRPRISLRLKGKTKRGDFPSLRAEVIPRPGDANFSAATVTMPPSLFLEQANIEQICTRAQFARDACPKGSAYGYAKAFTPLLDQPIEGPVYLRASDNDLPDVVASLRGGGIGANVEVVGRIDSKGGGIRGTFTGLPDAPASRFLFTLRGGKRGILVAAEDLCEKRHFAKARFISQSNRGVVVRPRIAMRCGKGARGRGKGKGARRKGRAQ